MSEDLIEGDLIVFEAPAICDWCEKPHFTLAYVLDATGYLWICADCIEEWRNANGAAGAFIKRVTGECQQASEGEQQS